MYRTKMLLLLGVLLLCVGRAEADDLSSDDRYYCSRGDGQYFAAARDEDAVRQYGRGRPADIKHIKLDLTLDFENESLSGTATTTLAPVGDPLDEIVFDSVGLDISKVLADDGSELDFEVTTDKLKVFQPHPAQPGEEFSVAVTYSTKPATGMHFRTERMGYKPEETQAWTQGEAEYARYWFPCFDYPNERASTEMIATVPEELMALSNGELLEVTADPSAGTKTYHWLQSVPHVSYLVSLVVGRYVDIKDSYRDIPLHYYVPPEREQDARLSFAKTPDMVRFFEEKIGVPYPYEKYAQVTVVDFVVSGMENTSITTLTERTLHDEAAHLTYSSDWLVAHELAHQWWADLLTCRDWSHIWLNEGFATYFQALYTEHDRGEDEFAYDLLSGLRRIIDVDKGPNRAPIVRTEYSAPWNLFDARSYTKGEWVLHMLRRQLGDDLFWKCMHEYCVRHIGEAVETTDLMRTIEDVTGRGMERFFDQWVYHGGYPELDISYSWENDEKLAKLVVKQTQTVDEITPVFEFSTEILFSCPGGDHVETVEISEKEHTFHVPLPEPPEFVRFDPNCSVLARVEFDKPKPMLLAQLAGDKTAVGRVLATEGLKKLDTDVVVEALEKALLDDAFWGVRAKAAAALGEVDNDNALDALLAGLQQEEARVRIEVVKALGTIDKSEAHDALIRVVDTEQSPYVVAAALEALGTLKVQKAKKRITKALSHDSHNEVVRCAAFEALVSLEAEDSLKTIAAYTASGKPRTSRPDAISAVGRLGKWMDEKDKPRKVLLDLLEDPSPRIRSAVVRALGDLGDPQAIDEIETFAETSKDPDEKKRAEQAVKEINAAREQTEEVKELRKQVEELKKAGDKTDKRIKEIESLVNAMKKEKEKEDGEESDETAAGSEEPEETRQE